MPSPQVPQPEQGSESEYEPGFSGESEVEADDIPGSIVALQSFYGMFLPANLQAKDNNLTGSDGEPQVNVSEYLLSIECLPSSLVSAKEAENCKQASCLPGRLSDISMEEEVLMGQSI